MNFIETGQQGKTNFSAYIFTFLLGASCLIGFGQIPYSYALSRMGIPSDQWANVPFEEAIELMGKNAFLSYQIFPFIAGLAGLIYSVKFILKRPIITVFSSRTHFDLKRFFTSFFLWGFLLMILLGFSVFVLKSPVEWNFNSETFFGLLTLSLFLIPLQTAFEDLLFRGLLLQGFGGLFKKTWITVLVSAFLFGGMHFANPEVQTLGYGVMIYYIGSGLFLAMLCIWDDGLELSMGFHAMNNIFGTLILTNKWQVFQTDALLMDLSKPSFGLDAVLILLLFMPFMLYVFARIYKWKSFKEMFLGDSIRKNEAS